MWDFLYSIGSYKQKCGIFGQICPTGHPTIPPKNTLAEVGYLRLHLQDTLQIERVSVFKNSHHVEVGDENKNPQLWDYAHNPEVWVHFLYTVT
jgi:hypothetical protein